MPPAAPGRTRGANVSTVARAAVRRRRSQPHWWAIIAAAAAAGLGAAATQGTAAAIAVAVVVIVVAASVLRPSSLLLILAASIFMEVIALGGVTVSRLLAPVALLFVVLAWLRGRATMWLALPVAWVTGYAVWALASTLWSSSQVETRTLLASLAIAVVYMSAFAVLITSESDLRGVLSVMALASFVVGLLSLLTFAGLGGSADSLQSGRAQGGVGDPNFFANIQIVAFPLMLVLASATRDQLMRLLIYGAALTTLASALATLSRGGLIALIAIVAVLPFMPARAMLGTPRQKALVMLILTLGLLGLFSRPGFRTEVFKRAQTIFTGGQETGSSAGSGRTEIWKAARHAIDDHPVLGVGFGAFPSVSSEYLLSTPGVDLTKFAPRETGIQAHSAYIGTTAELGLVGIALFLGIIASTALTLRRTAVRAFRVGAELPGRVANACLLSLVGWTISSTFIETETARALWIVIGIALALPKLIPPSARARGRALPQRPRS